MEQDEKRLMIQVAADSVAALSSEVDGVATAPSKAIEQKHLSGDLPVWILAATVAVNALPTLLAAVSKYVDQKKVTRLQIGDVVIENPQPEDLEIFREKWRKS